MVCLEMMRRGPRCLGLGFSLRDRRRRRGQDGAWRSRSATESARPYHLQVMSGRRWHSPPSRAAGGDSELTGHAANMWLEVVELRRNAKMVRAGLGGAGVPSPAGDVQLLADHAVLIWKDRSRRVNWSTGSDTWLSGSCRGRGRGGPPTTPSRDIRYHRLTQPRSAGLTQPRSA